MFILVATALLGLFDDALDASSWNVTLSKPGVNAAFVAFVAGAEHCGNLCDEMMETWVQLGEKLEDHPNLLIGLVECDKQPSMPLCRRFSVRGLPHLMYFMPPDPLGEVYVQDRNKTEFVKFAKQLASTCYPSITDDDGCNKQFERLEEMGIEKVKEKYIEIRTHLNLAKDEFENIMMEMQRDVSQKDPTWDGETWEKGKGEAIQETREKLGDKAKYAQDVLRTVEERVGGEYRAMKAWLAPHGGAGEGVARTELDDLLDKEREEEKAKRKAEKKKRKKKGTGADGSKKPKMHVEVDVDGTVKVDGKKRMKVL